MEPRLTRRWAPALPLLVAAAGVLPVSAQTQAAGSGPEKYRVLVPSLERTPDGRGNFGRDLAEELRKLIAAMPRHVPVARKEMQDQMKRYQLKEEEMGCVQNMQLAVQMNAELVVCGRFSGGSGSFRLDSVQVINAKTQESFKLQQITSSSAREAAAQIFTEFDRYVTALLHGGICYDYLASNEWDRAITNCEEARKVNPNSPRANMGIGFALYSKAIAANPPDQSMLRQALDLYKKVLSFSQTPEQEALRMAGIIAARVGLNEESRNFFAQYLELNPGDVQVRIQIANEQSKAGDSEGALRVVEAGLKTDSLNADLLTFAGIFAAQAAIRINEQKNPEPGQIAPEARVMYENAARYYKKLFDSKNGDVEPSIIPGMLVVLVSLDRAPEAVAIGERAVANPKTATAAVIAAQGGALANTGKNAEAVAMFDRAIAMNDTTQKDLRARKANVQLRSGDLPGAVASFRAAIGAGESKPDSISNMIWAIGYTDKFRSDDFEGFLRYLDAAGQFALSPLEKSKLSYFGGYAHSSIGRAVKVESVANARTALPHFQRAIRLFEGGELYARETNNMSQYQTTMKGLRDYATWLQDRIKSGR